MDGFDAWVRYLFDRPQELDEGRQDLDAVRDGPVAKAERVRHLFRNAGDVLRPYSDDQVGWGLHEIVDGGDIREFMNRKVPVVLRTTGLRSIVTLFAQVFAQRIQVEETSRTPPLQHVCFMFFDIAPIDLGDDTVLDVLEDTLKLPSIPCQRAALHGLGHAHMRSPEPVWTIVGRWLEKHPNAPQELRDYAASARIGDVM
jgi:hypothetical protein